MSSIDANSQSRSFLPAISVSTLMLILFSGALGTMAFDIFGKVISPLAGFGGLSPVGLARGFLGAVGLPKSAAYGNLMHLFLVGMIAYPVGWLFIARPLFEKFMPALPWIIGATVYGIGLWVFAIGGITVIAGMKSFLGFTTITWVSLVGHIIFGIVAAATVVYLEKLQNR
ncbi:MAG: hypothetical protein AAGK67_02705 [Pseudomonadota bacterium]